MRPPAGRGLEALLRAKRAPTGRAWDAGLWGRPCGDRRLNRVGPSPAFAAAVATSRSAGGGSLLPLAAGLGAPFSPPSGAELSSRVPSVGTGAPRALPAPPRPRHDEWAGGARPGRKQAPPARSAKRAGTRPGARPGLIPGAGEGRLGSALPLGLPGSSGTPPQTTDHK